MLRHVLAKLAGDTDNADLQAVPSAVRGHGHEVRTLARQPGLAERATRYASCVPLVGDPERDQAVSILRGAYARGTIGIEELEPRVESALHARSARQLAGSVRGIPGGTAALAIDNFLVPAVRVSTLGIRIWLAALIGRVVLAGWIVTTALLLGAFGVWALAAGPPVRGGVAFLLVWLAVSCLAVALRRGARRLARP